MHKKYYEIAKKIWGDRVHEDDIIRFLKEAELSKITIHDKVIGQALLDNYMESFISSMEDIVFELDNEGRIIHVWAADESILWGTREDILYKTTKEYIPPPLGEMLYNAFLEVQRVRMPVEVEYQSPFDDESYYLARLNIINDYNLSRNHVSVLVKNITEKKKADKALLEAMRIAEDAVNAKSQFLSSMSHEVRTPLNAIVGLTDILLSLPQNEENMEYLRSIKHSSDNLLNLVNDILSFSKTEIGKVVFEKIDFNLQEQINELQKVYAVRAVNKHISFHTEISPDIPEMLTGDPYRLNQILFNLIGNALKFTERGTVALNVFIAAQEQDTLTLRFEISDTGIGIPADKLDKIFESFTQASSDTTRKFGGTGLGLAITKNLVIQQEGIIYVKSEENKGSVFVVELPFSASLHAEGKPANIHIEKQPLSQLKILVAEDNNLNQLIIKKLLDEWQVCYTIVNNGKEAVEYMIHHKVDLVLMDLHMPEMDGIQAASAIRNRDTEVLNPDIPIIAFTADAFPETKIKVLESGMNDFITKPFKKDELYAKMVKHLHLS